MSGAKLVLLVEDNRLDAELALDALSRSGVAHTVHVAGGGQEALDCLEFESRGDSTAPAGMPALILLDLKMPSVDGFEVLQRLRASERLRRIPVVVLTSSRDEADRDRCCDEGANSYVVKPISHDEFVRVVGSVLEYWLTVNES